MESSASYGNCHYLTLENFHVNSVCCASITLAFKLTKGSNQSPPSWHVWSRVVRSPDVTFPKKPYVGLPKTRGPFLGGPFKIQMSIYVCRDMDED